MHGMILFVLCIAFLWIGRSIFIPLLVAVFLWYLINAIATYYRKVIPCSRGAECRIWVKHAMDWMARIAAVGTLVGLIYIFATQVRPMFSELFVRLPAIQHRLTIITSYLADTIGLQLDVSLLPNVAKIAKTVGASAASIAASMGMILIYMLFMFIEQSTFNKKFNRLNANKNRAKKIRYILDSVDENMKKYLFMKTLVSAATGALSYLWLRSIGLEFAGVWAFIIFTMNYIPTLGSIIACALPILYALTVAPSLQLPILTASGLIVLQVLLGNIIEPKLTGRTLNLSTLAILINLVFWGMIWGVAGMFFSVPILVALFITTAQFDSTRWVAVLLSADGKIPDKNDD